MVQNKNGGTVVTILFAILILILSIIPTDFSETKPSLLFPGIDKLVHGLLYGVFTILVINEYLKHSQLKIGMLIILLSGIWIYSILMEIVQLLFIEYRTGDWRDALANFVGIVVGSVIILAVKRIKS